MLSNKKRHQLRFRRQFPRACCIAKEDSRGDCRKRKPILSWPFDKWDAIFLCFPPRAQLVPVRKDCSFFISPAVAGFRWEGWWTECFDPRAVGNCLYFDRRNFGNEKSFWKGWGREVSWRCIPMPCATRGLRKIIRLHLSWPPPPSLQQYLAF